MYQLLLFGVITYSLLLIVRVKSNTSKPKSLVQFNKNAIIKNSLISISSLALFNNNYNCNNNNHCKCFKCIKAANAVDDSEEEWYNPKNERIFDTLHNSYLPAHPELYLPRDLGSKRIITIGEVHSNPCHHRVEFEIIRSLASFKDPSNIAIGLECFYRQHQKALDRFVYYHNDMATLKEETKWTETWGYDLNYYAKIFNFAAKKGIRLVGLNVPIEVASLVGRVGIDNIPPVLKSLLPNVDLKDEKHRNFFMDSIKSSGHNINDNAAVNRMYEVQTLWDEYMSESAANYINKFPESVLVVIAGTGHVQGRVSIPNRIQKRISTSASNPFVIVPQQVMWSKENGLPIVDSPLSPDDCDWAWYTEREIITRA